MDGYDTDRGPGSRRQRPYDPDYRQIHHALRHPLRFDHVSTDTTAGRCFQKDGTYVNYRVVYLQRLANPLLPYDNTPTDPGYNPYRTIDQMAVDVTAFNGIEWH